MISASRPASPSPTQSAQARNAEKRVSIYHLPSEFETRELMRRYFSNTGLLFPYIHEPTFLETYELMKADNFTQVRRTWLGLLNMILAMASSTSASSDKSSTNLRLESDVFYQRAYELCKRQMLRGTSLETGQLLNRKLLTMHADSSIIISPIPPAHVTIFAGYAQKCTNLGHSWLSRQSCSLPWPSLDRCGQEIFSHRARNKKTDMVWLRDVRQVRKVSDNLVDHAVTFAPEALA